MGRANEAHPPAYFDEHSDEEDNIADVCEPSSEPDPVLCAVLVGDARRIAALLELGCSWKGRTWRRRGALHLAARCGSVATVRVLLGSGCSAVGAPDLYGHSSLHLAARAGHLAVARVLVADPNSGGGLGHVVNRFVDGPLHLAVCNGHCDVAACLLTAGASAVATNKRGDSSLQLALAPRNSPSAMSRLVLDGVLRDADGDATVLTRALVQMAWAGQAHAAAVLVGAGARHGVGVDDDCASAMEAAVHGSNATGLVMTLVVMGASCGPFPPLAPPFDRADAPLNVLARRGRAEDLPAATVLLASGADVKYRDAVSEYQQLPPLENAATLGRRCAGQETCRAWRECQLGGRPPTADGAALGGPPRAPTDLPCAARGRRGCLGCGRGWQDTLTSGGVGVGVGTASVRPRASAGVARGRGRDACYVQGRVCWRRRLAEADALHPFSSSGVSYRFRSPLFCRSLRVRTRHVVHDMLVRGGGARLVV